MRAKTLWVAASSEGTTMSAPAASRRARAPVRAAELVSRTILTLVIRRMPAMMRPRPEWRVGSPEPENVIASTGFFLANAFLIWPRMVSTGTNSRRRTVVFPLDPSWQ